MMERRERSADEATNMAATGGAIKHDNKHLLVFIPENMNLLFAALNYLADYVDIHEKKAVVLRTVQDKGNDGRYVITFKVKQDYKFDNNFFVSVSQEKWYKFRLMQVHSKSEHKVYYTLNALKSLVPDKDKNAVVPWEEYKQKVLYTNQGELKMVDTELVGVVNLDPDYASESDAKRRNIFLNDKEAD